MKPVLLALLRDGAVALPAAKSTKVEKGKPQGSTSPGQRGVWQPEHAQKLNLPLDTLSCLKITLTRATADIKDDSQSWSCIYGASETRNLEAGQ